jgi:hypothetical protein
MDTTRWPTSAAYGRVPAIPALNPTLSKYDAEMPGERDIRSKDPDVDRRRRARFHTGWEHAVRDNRTYEERDGITWASIGNRCGKALGWLSEEKR